MMSIRRGMFVLQLRLESSKMAIASGVVCIFMSCSGRIMLDQLVGGAKDLLACFAIGMLMGWIFLPMFKLCQSANKISVARSAVELVLSRMIQMVLKLSVVDEPENASAAKRRRHVDLITCCQLNHPSKLDHTRSIPGSSTCSAQESTIVWHFQIGLEKIDCGCCAMSVAFG